MSKYTNPKRYKTPYFISPPRGVSSNHASQCSITPEKWKRKKKPPGMCGNIKTIRRPDRKGDTGLWSNGPCKVTVAKPGKCRGPDEKKKRRNSKICPKRKESWWPSPVDHDQRDQPFLSSAASRESTRWREEGREQGTRDV